MTQTATPLRGEKLIYTGKVRTTGGRDHGNARSSDGALEVRFSPPGSGRLGTNPEQLLAAGWSACFEAAIRIAARRQKLTLPQDPTIDAEVDLNQGGDGAFLRACLNVTLPEVERNAQAVVEEAHKTCPYSKALSRSIDIEVNLV